MNREQISEKKAGKIKAALKEHSRFLAYVRVNALLHDGDKVTSEFLRWSMDKNSVPKEEYPGHETSSPEERLNFLASKEKLFQQHEMEPIAAPVRRIALKTDTLQQEQCADILQQYIGDENFINNLSGSSLKDLQKYFYLDKKGKIHKDFFKQNYTPIFTKGLFSKLTGHPVSAGVEWLFEFHSGISLYDFYAWHHRPNFYLKTKSHVATSLLLFSAGTAGIDGIDTKYETESDHKGNREHHRPDIAAEQSILIANPFGYERKVQWETAESLLKRSKTVGNFLAAWQQGNPVSHAVALEAAIRPAFEQSIIRTGRPINDITLADHAISTAALAAAQAARLVLETGIGEVTEKMYYSLPVRREQSDWPLTNFAVFSCAVNADKLDQMALELKDITAIRDEVNKLLKHFLSLFSEKYPVGGAVYQDQHGAHVVVPVLGDPTKRWVKGGADTLVRLEEQTQRPEWADAPPDALSNEEFVDWLFATAQEALRKFPVNFGAELLIGLRHQPIAQELNKLADAIDWTRSLSSLSMIAGGTDAKGAAIRAFNYGRADTGKVTFDLCGVCGLRMGTDRKHRKCDICEQRIIDHHKRHRQAAVRETNDIDQLAQYSADHRMVLLTVSFNLAQWLAETDNSGIFCHDAGRNKVKKKNQDAELQKIADEKIRKYQRYNSFGRFRRIWRSTEIFLKGLQEQIQQLSGGSGTANTPYLMRTILLAPQDLQIILPAARARQALDAVYDKFHKEFGRVSDRMPFHVSLCIFPFRVPIYLVLEAARRLRQSCLNKELKETKLSVYDEILLRTDMRTDGHGWERSFTYPLPMIWTQKHQPPNMLKGYDQFHANIQVQQQKEEGKASWEWQFVGNIGQGRKDWTGETARMTDNRLAIVEISSGFSLDELARPSEKLEPSRCHDIPLGYWPCLKELLRLESDLSETQQRRLRSVLALREKLWQESDLPGATPEERQDFLRESICLLWQDPSCFGPAGWKKLVKNKQNLLLEESCLNGAGFLASVVKEHLHNNDDKEQDRG
uniref:hypothetical protein n=1 Tax=Candidatus Electrothrix sp. TaxID=2170559 RepID=UPI004055EE8F